MAQNGKAFNEYMHQAAPGAKVERFSDKPINVAGVHYSPKWAWSDGYRKWFRAAHRDQPPYNGGDYEQYRNWLVRQRLMTVDEAVVYIRRQQAA